MKKVIVTIAMTVVSMVSYSQDVNKFIFASGMEPNAWNVSVFNKDIMIYFNYSTDSNYEIYQVAMDVVEENGMDFSSPTSSNSYDDGFVTITNVVYENVPFGSDSRYDMEYENDSVRILVMFSEHGSSIYLYKK